MALRGMKADTVDAGHGVVAGFLPRGIADMGLVHHVVPLAVGQFLVVLMGEDRVFFKEVDGAGCKIVGGGPSLGGIEAVKRYRIIEFVEVGAGEDGKEDQLVIGCFCIGWQLSIDGLRLYDQFVVVGNDFFCLAVVEQVVGIGR